MMNRRTIFIGTAVFIIILLLAGGVVTAVRLLAPDNEAETAVAANEGGKVVQSISSQNGGPSVAVQTTIRPP